MTFFKQVRTQRTRFLVEENAAILIPIPKIMEMASIGVVEKPGTAQIKSNCHAIVWKGGEFSSQDRQGGQVYAKKSKNMLFLQEVEDRRNRILPF